MNKKRLLLLGGDLRQYYMAKSLTEVDFAISYFGLSFPQELPVTHRCKDKGELFERMAKENSILILPVPVTTDGITVKSNELIGERVALTELMEHLHVGLRIYGGNVPRVFAEYAQKKGCILVDFTKNDTVAIKNAVATAEGAMLEAKLLSDETIFGSQSLVLGFGRCAEVLADRLKALGSRVTVAARREEVRARAETYGYDSIDFTKDAFILKKPYKWQFVFNTVPEMILDARFLNGLSEHVIIIDIASAPGGLDYDYAKKQRLTAKLCPGLPGKYAAKSAGEILAQVIQNEEAPCMG